MAKQKKITDLGKYLNERTLAKMKKNKVVPQDTAPPQYRFTNMPLLPTLQCYPNIALTCMNQLIKRKLFVKNPACYKEEIIEACINYSKTKGGSFNIRKKRKILEFDSNKLSNFLVLMVCNIHSCLDNTLYTCYYVTTIKHSHSIIIAVPQTEPDHAKAIEEKLNELNMFDYFELSGDFKQVYNFCLHFKAYVSKQKEETFREFIFINYEIIENEEYIKYLNEKKEKKLTIELTKNLMN